MYCHRKFRPRSNIRLCYNHDLTGRSPRWRTNQSQSPHWAFYHTGVSSETSTFGVRVFDTYGIRTANLILTLPKSGPNKGWHFKPNADGHSVSTEQLIVSYENRIQDLQKQLDLASKRETALISEKSQLLNLTDRLQQQTETLMLLPAPAKKRVGWIG